MKRQKSFENHKPTLFLVPTPIGNLSEMSPRALEVLNQVDVIACEDTRTSGTLLKHFNISKRLIAYHNYNEESSARGILQLLEEGKNVALISDAGYPLINDPGQRVVFEITEAGYNVVPVSGPSAFLDGLVASGLVAQPFLFIGFLPQNTTDRNKKLQLYQDYPMTMVFYEAPHRIQKMLTSCLDILGDRQCVIARELTKVHEEFLRGTVSEMIEVSDDLKGEMVIIMDGNHDNKKDEIDLSMILNMVETSVQAGMSTRDAIKEVSLKTGVSKNVIYDAVHETKRS